jgi:hypothetical protein
MASPVKLFALIGALVCAQLLMGVLIKAKWIALFGGMAGGLNSLCLSLALVAGLGITKTVNWPVVILSTVVSAILASVLVQPVAGTITVLTSAVLYSALDGYTSA